MSAHASILASADIFEIGSSYRRDVSWLLARSIRDSLQSRKFKFDAFLDVDGLRGGKWRDAVVSEIEKRNHFVIVLDQGTLERCKEPQDPVAMELRLALKLERNIVPVYSAKFQFSDCKRYLPKSLQILADYDSVRIDDVYFDAAITRLVTRLRSVKYVEVPKEDAIVPPSSSPNVLSKADVIEKAIENCSQVLHRHSQDVATRFHRGNAYFLMGDIENAERDFATILRFDLNYANAYLGLGNCYYVWGYFDEAYESYLRYIVLIEDREIPHPDVMAVFQKLKNLVGD